jgi:hypothetical protein
MEKEFEKKHNGYLTKNKDAPIITPTVDGV